MENADILRQLTEEEVVELLGLYKKQYGHKNFHYLLMYNQTKWNNYLKKIDNDCGNDHDIWISFRKTFYTHRNCDFRKYGTYISLHNDLIQSVSFNSWEPDLKELWECISDTKLIEWAKGPLLTNVDLKFCEYVKNIAETKGVAVQRARRCCGLILENKKALNLEIQSVPAAYTMKPLEIENAELIHSLWTNKKEGSLEYIRGLIKINKTLGIYRDEDKALVAWIFQNDFSGLGILEVLPDIQRRGIGSLLSSKLSQLIAQSEEVNLSAWTVEENFRSLGLLQKMGFEITVMNEWIQLSSIN